MTYLDRVADAIAADVRDGDPPNPDDRPLYLMYAVLALAKGETTTATDVHDAWVAWMASLGRTDASMVPFDELPAEVQQEDEPFVEAIHRAALLGRSKGR